MNINYKLSRRLLSIVLLLATLFTLCACGKTKENAANQINIDDIVIGSNENSSVSGNASSSGSDGFIEFASDGDISYSAPLYILFMQDPFSEIQTAYDLNYNEVTSADVMLSDGTISTGSQYISSNADEEFKWMYTINHLFREASLKDEESSGYSQAVYYAGQTYKENSSYYKNFNISMTDLLEFYLYQYKTNDLFKVKYGENGENEIPHSELEEMMESGAYRFEYILLPYYDVTTQAKLDDEEIEKRNNMITDFSQRAANGESFEDLVYESYSYLDPSTKKSDESDYYENYIEADNTSFLSPIMKALSSMEDNEIKLIKQDSYCALVKKLPVNENINDSWENMAMQIAYSSDYGTEFDKFLISEYNATEIEYNEAFRSVLTPEYYAEMLDKFYNNK